MVVGSVAIIPVHVCGVARAAGPVTGATVVGAGGVSIRGGSGGGAVVALGLPYEGSHDLAGSHRHICFV